MGSAEASIAPNSAKTRTHHIGRRSRHRVSILCHGHLVQLIVYMIHFQGAATSVMPKLRTIAQTHQLAVLGIQETATFRKHIHSSTSTNTSLVSKFDCGDTAF